MRRRAGTSSSFVNSISRCSPSTAPSLFKLPHTLGLYQWSGAFPWEDLLDIRKAIRAAIEEVTRERNGAEGLLHSFTSVSGSWERSYSPERNAAAVAALGGAPVEYRIGHLVARLFFRGIYFPQMDKRAWLRLLYDNRRPIYKLVKEAAGKWREARGKRAEVPVAARAS